MAITAQQVTELARECGFELAGVAAALPSEDFARFEEWRANGFAGQMSYLTDRRGDLRSDPRNLSPIARSIVCVGKLYNTPGPLTDRDPESGWISRYAWGSDYHDILREGLKNLVLRIGEVHGEPFESKICIDTAPLLERSYARAAGLGWVGKNTCLINQQEGSWFFLGEVLISIPLDPGFPAPDRCGTCRRCIDACPTDAIVAKGYEGWTIDSQLCISYLTIEKRGRVPEERAREVGNHIFGCDICQDVCPWNRRAGFSDDFRFRASNVSRDLEELATLSEAEFREFFRNSPVWRARYEGFLRNVAIAMGNSGSTRMNTALSKLRQHPNELVATTATEVLERIMKRAHRDGDHQLF